MSEKISKIVSIIVFLLIIGGIGYYFWPEGTDNTNQPIEFNLDELNIIKTDLSETEIENYETKYDASIKILEDQPDDFWALMEVASIRKQAGDLKGAEAAWLQVVELNPQNSTAFGNLADLYTNFLKDNVKAEEAYKMAIQNSLGESFNILFTRNYFEFALYSLEDKARAEEILLIGIAANPKSAGLMALLASFYQDEGRTVDAIIYFEKTLELDPEDTVVQDELDKLR